MQYIPHPQHTRNLGAPIGWDHSKVHCGSLSISDKTMQGMPVMESYWKPEGFEDVMIMLGTPIALGVYAQSHPPVSIILPWQEPKSRAAYIDATKAAFAKMVEHAKANGLSVSIDMKNADDQWSMTVGDHSA